MLNDIEVPVSGLLGCSTRHLPFILMLLLFGLHYQRFQSTDRMSEAYNDRKLQSLRYYIEQCKHAWLVCKT
jgi:hypothetical protein